MKRVRLYLMLAVMAGLPLVGVACGGDAPTTPKPIDDAGPVLKDPIPNPLTPVTTCDSAKSGDDNGGAGSSGTRC